MTALNVIVQDRAAHLITDAASYTPLGLVTAISSKVVPFPALRAALAVRGAVTADVVRRVADEARPRTQRALLDLMEPMLRRARQDADSASPQSVGHPAHEGSITAISWDGVRRTTRVWHIGSDEHTVIGGAAPWVRYSGSRGWTSPPVPLSSDDWNKLDPVEDGRRILLAQREQRAVTPWLERIAVVGGFGELTTVDARGVRQQRLIDWPDCIGEPIAPLETEAEKLARFSRSDAAD